MVYFNYFTNPFNPNKGRISRVLTNEELTINLIAEQQDVDFSLPVVCIVDGQAVLRKIGIFRLIRMPP